SPNIAFRDLVIQTRENDLVGATFGRSFYILDDYTPLRSVTNDMLQNQTVLFPVRETDWYVPRRVIGCFDAGCQAAQGDSYFVAPNPEFGATFTYYLPEGIKKSQETRREAEKEREAENQNVQFADWGTIISEQREDEPLIILTVRDGDVNVVRHVEGTVNAGFNRVAWDLRYPVVDAWVPEAEAQYLPSAGVLVAPGEYTVSIHKRIDGVVTDLAQTQSFDVVSIREPTLEGDSQEHRVVFEAQVDELIRAADGTINAIDRISEEINALKEVLVRSTADAALYEIADSIQERMLEQRDVIAGNETRDIFHDWDNVSVQNRLFHARFVARANAYGPTPVQRESYSIARRAYDEAVVVLTELVDDEYASLKEALDGAGVPWSPGRGIQ
ncbi:MAG: hypothetical protein ACE5F8_04190, partial [Woeseiaceae bacterium]